MGKIYVPSPVEHSVWRIDSVGDLFAVAVIFGLIFVVGLASCFEVMA